MTGACLQPLLQLESQHSENNLSTERRDTAADSSRRQDVVVRISAESS